jgi:4-amino-4-deoxychorismate lyase
MVTTLVNGIVCDYISVQDRGLHYGDGVFETLAYVEGHFQFLQQHLARMQDGAERLGIPYPDESLFLSDIRKLLQKAAAPKGVFKLILTRGQSQRGYRPANKSVATRICQYSDWPEHMVNWKSEGIDTCICNTRASVNTSVAGIKHLNRLENVLASSELGANYQEGFLLDNSDNVIEGTMSNIFAVFDNTLVTPELSCSGIEGIIREQVLTIAEENRINTEIRCVSKDEIVHAREIFICNSLLGVCAVNTIDGVKVQSNNITNIIDAALNKRMSLNA